MNKLIIFVFLAIGGIFVSCSHDEEIWICDPSYPLFGTGSVKVHRGDSLLLNGVNPFMVQRIYVAKDEFYWQPRSEAETHLLTLLDVTPDMTELNFHPQHGKLQWLSVDVPNDSTLILKVDKDYSGEYPTITIDCFCPERDDDPLFSNGLKVYLKDE